MNCPQCGMPLREGARWCDRCGARTPDSSNSDGPRTGAQARPGTQRLRSWQKQCPSCGKVSSNETVCGYCGAQLVVQATPVKKNRGSYRELALLALGALLVLAFVGNNGSSIDKARSGSDPYGQATPAQVEQAVEPTATPLPSTATATPTPDTALLLRRTDIAWAKADWPEAISVLQQLRKMAPGSVDFENKLYVAYLSYGVKLLAAGDKQGAATQFNQAQSVSPSRPEARAQLAALTPTATPTLTVDQQCAKAEELDPGAIAVDPNAFKGRVVVLKGTINAADYQYSGDYTLVQFLADIPYRPYDNPEIVAIRARGRAPGLVRGKWMKVCGVVSGSEQIDTAAAGAKKSVPSIQALRME